MPSTPIEPPKTGMTVTVSEEIANPRTIRNLIPVDEPYPDPEIETLHRDWTARLLDSIATALETNGDGTGDST